VLLGRIRRWRWYRSRSKKPRAPRARKIFRDGRRRNPVRPSGTQAASSHPRKPTGIDVGTRLEVAVEIPVATVIVRLCVVPETICRLAGLSVHVELTGAPLHVKVSAPFDPATGET
jgi:hypothetical protein